jgi:hypothetical protein
MKKLVATFHTPEALMRAPGRRKKKGSFFSGQNMNNQTVLGDFERNDMIECR